MKAQIIDNLRPRVLCEVQVVGWQRVMCEAWLKGPHKCICEDQVGRPPELINSNKGNFINEFSRPDSYGSDYVPKVEIQDIFLYLEECEEMVYSVDCGRQQKVQNVADSRKCRMWEEFRALKFVNSTDCGSQCTRNYICLTFLVLN